ncbi:Uncharacterized protein FWK35_00018225 [Aphis craccivora]|uniref:Integrase catalytic domain-containing protein n=1 Tax=Aphis craccivora TaxID=307492 RepID=A0A6G0YEC0_APHCR|nr:Uncharacterized protein FWK35_00018225 [Aphis craccivora]
MWVGIDFAGPLTIRELKLRKARECKVYISVFICMTVKAVHLEIVTDLSTSAFLAALDRFVARRGLPSDIYSDCGTNFVGASKQLRQYFSETKTRDQLSSRIPCSWHFNPPSAPHFGGIWEAAVKSMKRLLVRVVGAHTLTYEELNTVICRIESVLNSRPLTPLSSDPGELESLTPGHFLVGQPLLCVPEPNVLDTPDRLTSRWKLLHQCHQAFWKRWSSEYLNNLQLRSKWTSIDTPLKVGDLVLIKDNLTTPLGWRLGRIIELLPGRDEVVRVVKLMTRQESVLTRCVTGVWASVTWSDWSSTPRPRSSSSSFARLRLPRGEYVRTSSISDIGPPLVEKSSAAAQLGRAAFGVRQAGDTTDAPLRKGKDPPSYRLLSFALCWFLTVCVRARYAVRFGSQRLYDQLRFKSVPITSKVYHQLRFT